MTEQDRKQQRANLVVELEDAQRDLAHERETALVHADSLEIWAKRLRTDAAREPTHADFVPTMEDSDIRTESRYQECLSFGTLLRTFEKLREARQKVSNLELRKMQLSAPSGFPQVKL